jgi:outer membrane protein assembly factor BamE
MIATHYHRHGRATPVSMNRYSAFARAAFLFVTLGLGLGAGGCVYRPNIQQGNLLKVEDVEQVTPGMTRSQVRYLLGTPMLGDPFDPQRWDYIYTLQRGRLTKIDRAHFVVRFEGDNVSKVERLDLPDGFTNPKKKKKQSVPLPSETQPATTTPLPSETPPPGSPSPGGTY